jgi:amino acid transporter
MTDENKLPRVMGAFSATMLGVGAMIGAGIFVMSGIAAGYAGPAVIIALACNGLIAVCIGGCYAELASAMPWAGGSYFWVKQALGPGAGFGVGWISLYANTVAAALYVLDIGTFCEALTVYVGLPYDGLLSVCCHGGGVGSSSTPCARPPCAASTPTLEGLPFIPVHFVMTFTSHSLESLGNVRFCDWSGSCFQVAKSP